MSDHSPEAVEGREYSDRNDNRDDYSDRRDRYSARNGRKMSLLVRNLKLETTTESLRDAFEKFGSIRDVYLPLDYYTKKPRGFGFVEFHDFRDAKVALRNMDAAEIDGNKIEVFAAKRGRSDPYQMKNRERRSGRDRDYRHNRSPPSGSPNGRYRHRSRSFEHRDRHSRRHDRRSRRYSSKSPARRSSNNRRSLSAASRLS